ncbi:MAG: sugar ABC transporter substrate-binding protein, partial [Clostridiales bacterium]|nr:sugar ABC transporter substrate-binding protein [Clostridiales bacterium]
MKKALALFLSFCLILALASGCGGGKTSETAAPDGGGAPAKSARDQIYEIIEEYPIAFNGIPPKVLEDRTGIVKGLPVEKKDPKDITIGYVTGSVGSPFFTTMLNNLQKKCEDAGFKFIYQVSNFNTEVSLQQMDAFISQGVDIILANVDVQASGPTFKKAAEAGIPVVATSNQPVDTSANVITDILAGSYKAGFYVGEYNAKKLYKKGDVLDVGFVLIQFGTGDTESRSNGFVSGFLYGAREIDGNPYPSKWEAMLDGYNIWTKFTKEGKLDVSDKGLNLIGAGVDPNHQADAAGGQAGATDLITAHPDLDILFVECDP